MLKESSAGVGFGGFCSTWVFSHCLGLSLLPSSWSQSQCGWGQAGAAAADTKKRCAFRAEKNYDPCPLLPNPFKTAGDLGLGV